KAGAGHIAKRIAAQGRIRSLHQCHVCVSMERTGIPLIRHQGFLNRYINSKAFLRSPPLLPGSTSREVHAEATRRSVESATADLSASPQGDNKLLGCIPDPCFLIPL